MRLFETGQPVKTKTEPASGDPTVRVWGNPILRIAPQMGGDTDGEPKYFWASARPEVADHSRAKALQHFAWLTEHEPGADCSL